MDETQTSLKLSQAEPPQAQKEQTTPAATTRKRQIDDDDHEPPLKRARLTRKNLAAFNKMGKKNSDPTDDSSTTKTKTTSTTTSGFAVKARKNGILDPRSSKPPTNIDDIRKRHTKTRATASPPESAYEDYVDRVEGAGTEATIVAETSELLKKYPKGYRREFNRSFTNFPKNAGFNDGLSAPQPDYVEGLEMEEYLPFPVDDRVPGATLYKDDPRSLTLPHLAGEWKGPAGDIREARMQSAYDGAALVHARNQALAYMGKSDPPGHAEITTFTSDGTNLNLYAHYATPSNENENTLEYHQYPIAETNIKGSYQGHKDGRKGLRNTQDYAKDQSYALRDQLKEHWKQHRSDLHTIAEGAPLPDDTYEEDQYEDEAGYEIVEQPCQPTPAASSAEHKKSHSHSSSHHTSTHSSHKRKASSSHGSSHGSSDGSSKHASKHKSYWKKNANGYYYHKHSDGSITWYDDVANRGGH